MLVLKQNLKIMYNFIIYCTNLGFNEFRSDAWTVFFPQYTITKKPRFDEGMNPLNLSGYTSGITHQK